MPTKTHSGRKGDQAQSGHGKSPGQGRGASHRQRTSLEQVAQQDALGGTDATSGRKQSDKRGAWENGGIEALRLFAYYPVTRKSYELSDRLVSMSWSDAVDQAAIQADLELSNVDRKLAAILNRPGTIIFLYTKEKDKPLRERLRLVSWETTVSTDHTFTITAYDYLIYLQQARGDFKYKNKYAHEIAIDICKRFGIPVAYREVRKRVKGKGKKAGQKTKTVKKARIVKGTYKIPHFSMQKVSVYEAIANAYSIDRKKTGNHYYIEAVKGKLTIRRRGNPDVILDISPASDNLRTGAFTRSLENYGNIIELQGGGRGKDGTHKRHSDNGSPSDSNAGHGKGGKGSSKGKHVGKGSSAEQKKVKDAQARTELLARGTSAAATQPRTAARRASASGGGSGSSAAWAEKLNHKYKAHWSPDFSGEQLPPYVVAALAESAGAPGWTMAQIAHGESNYRPGAAAVDPSGGTKGYGLFAITTTFNDAAVRPYGGYEGMWNPIACAIVMGQIYKASGLTPWHGTQFLTDENSHYSGALPLVDLHAVFNGSASTQSGGHSNAPTKKELATRAASSVLFGNVAVTLTEDGLNIRDPDWTRKQAQRLANKLSRAKKTLAVTADGNIRLKQGDRVQAQVPFDDSTRFRKELFVSSINHNLNPGDYSMDLGLVWYEREADVKSLSGTETVKAKGSKGGSGTVKAGASPSNAPQRVQTAISRMVAEIDALNGKFTYEWGGGHQDIKHRLDKYDCSGFVSHILYVGGLLKSPVTSGVLAGMFSSGHGKWLTIYANSEHTFGWIWTPDGGRYFESGGSQDNARGWVTHTNEGLGGFSARHPGDF